MSVFNIGKTAGRFEHTGTLSVQVIGQCTESKRDPFNVVLDHKAGACGFVFHLTPDQSRDLRAMLEDAEAKAEILTAAI